MTAQIPEQLILDGKPSFMHSCPPIPENHSRINTVDFKELNEVGRSFSSTACWRRYIGSWEIRNERFYLIGVRGKYKFEETEPLLAKWFTGVLCVPRGEMLHYVHAGFASVYEEEVYLRIEKGEVINSSIINNRLRKFELDLPTYPRDPFGG